MELAHLLVMIVANCALEINHVMYLDQVKWKEILDYWLCRSEPEFLMHVKFLCSYLAPAIENDQFNLFAINQDELTTVVDLLGNASSSEDLIATNLQAKFSALELVETITHLCFYPPNLTAFAKADIMPGIISILVHANVQLSKAVLKLLWILLEDCNFLSHCEPYMDVVVEMCLSFTRNNQELQFLANLLYFRPLTTGKILHGIYVFVSRHIVMQGYQSKSQK